MISQDQRGLRRKGPLDNALDHLRDPFGQNVFTQVRLIGRNWQRAHLHLAHAAASLHSLRTKCCACKQLFPGHARTLQLPLTLLQFGCAAHMLEASVSSSCRNEVEVVLHGVISLSWCLDIHCSGGMAART